MCRVFVAWLSVACRVVFSRGAKLLVMSIEDRDYFIRQAYYDEGRSAVELAVEWDLSRSQIHRIVAAGPSAADDDDSDDPWTDEDAATLALLVESDSEELKEPPWIYDGWFYDHRGEPWAKWRDSKGREVTDLDRHRWRYRDGSVADRSPDADLDRQLADNGWKIVREDAGSPPHMVPIRGGRPPLRGFDESARALTWAPAP